LNLGVQLSLCPGHARSTAEAEGRRGAEAARGGGEDPERRGGREVAPGSLGKGTAEKREKETRQEEQNRAIKA